MKRTLYGVTELAEAVGVNPDVVAQWNRRGQLPAPLTRLAMGPVWGGESMTFATSKVATDDGGIVKRKPGPTMSYEKGRGDMVDNVLASVRALKRAKEAHKGIDRATWALIAAMDSLDAFDANDGWEPVT